MISGFGTILLFIIGAMLFLGVALFAGRLIRPNRPNVEKLTTYESGEDPIGIAWGQFNPRFYIIALIFLLFEVEIVFLFPWATIFDSKPLQDATGGSWGWLTFVEMLVFVTILALGLAYAWAKGYLEWERPDMGKTSYKSKIPKSEYDWLK